MTNPDPQNNDELNEVEEEMTDDEDATLADDLLDEVGGDDAVADEDLMEGFGILPEPAEDEEEEKEDEDDEESLEEDAEDVDFDRFDDVDEM